MESFPPLRFRPYGEPFVLFGHSCGRRARRRRHSVVTVGRESCKPIVGVARYATLACSRAAPRPIATFGLMRERFRSSLDKYRRYAVMALQGEAAQAQDSCMTGASLSYKLDQGRSIST